MQVIEVITKSNERKFLQVPKILYKDDPVWVCPLDRDIRNVFDPEVNTYFNHGIATRWILQDQAGQLIGRVAAFIDFNTRDKFDEPTGGMGFFECINDQEAANKLFDTAKNWLMEQGVEAMNGPINFGETDSYWGLLVDGFTHPAYEITYNPPYYQALFENYGFKVYYKQEGFHLDVTKPMPERFIKIAQWVAKKPEYTFKHFSWKDQKQMVADFAQVYNETWPTFKENFEPLKPEYIRRTLKKAKAIIEPKFIWIAYHQEKPVALYLQYPDVNMILKHLDGRLHLWNKVKFFWYLKRNAMTRARGVLMGVHPKYHGLGMESAFIWQMIPVFEKKKHYTEIEFNWVGDFNPRMRKMFLSTGAVSVKHYITYRYLYDRSKPYKRHPITSK